MKLRLPRVVPSVLLLVAAPAFGAPSPDAGPADLSPLSIEEVLRAPTLAAYSPPAFSPDGRLLAYVVTDNARRTGRMDDDEVRRQGFGWYGIAAEIWVTDLSTGERRKITEGGHNWSPNWSPDGTQLAFLGDRSGGSEKLGPARLWVWERSSGKLRQAGDADVREGHTGMPWLADGNSVLVSLFPEEMGREGWAASLEGKSASSDPRPGGVTARVFEFDPSAPGAAPMTDQVNLDYWRRDLGLIDTRTGNLRRIVTKARIGYTAFSADRRRMAYSILQRSEKPGAGQYLFDLVVQDLPDGKPRTVASGVRLDLFGDTFRLSPTADRIAWRTAGSLAQDEVFVVPVAGGEPRRISHNPKMDQVRFDVGPPVWDSAGKNLFFLREGVLWRAAADGSRAAVELGRPKDIEIAFLDVRQGRLFSPDGGSSAVVLATNPTTKRVGFARVDLGAGSVAPIFEEEKRYGGYGTEPAISPDGKSVAYVAEDPLHSPDLYVRGGDLSTARQVSEVAPALSSRAFGRAEVIEWRSIDGEAQRGALVYPAGYEKGKRYPLIVKVYGGSSISNDLNRFGYAIAAIENLQIYATRGYALLLADSKLHVGTPMVDLMKSVMPGIDAAIEKGVADSDRVGITGHSYGGYSTLSLIVQSPRFKAAVMRAGMGDMIAQYGQLAPDGTNYGLAWAETGQGRMGGSPWEFRERYLENSPIHYLDRVQTPLLIIHGGKDDAVPVYLADQVFTGLRRLGKAVTYARYEGEGHWEGTWSASNQLDALNREIAWFDRFLKGNAKASPTATTEKNGQPR